jgi:hypothetical protein
MAKKNLKGTAVLLPDTPDLMRQLPLTIEQAYHDGEPGRGAVVLVAPMRSPPWTDTTDRSTIGKLAEHPPNGCGTPEIVRAFAEQAPGTRVIDGVTAANCRYAHENNTLRSLGYLPEKHLCSRCPARPECRLGGYLSRSKGDRRPRAVYEEQLGWARDLQYWGPFVFSHDLSDNWHGRGEIRLGLEHIDAALRDGRHPPELRRPMLQAVRLGRKLAAEALQRGLDRTRVWRADFTRPLTRAYEVGKARHIRIRGRRGFAPPLVFEPSLDGVLPVNLCELPPNASAWIRKNVPVEPSRWLRTALEAMSAGRAGVSAALEVSLRRQSDGTLEAVSHLVLIREPPDLTWLAAKHLILIVPADALRFGVDADHLLRSCYPKLVASVEERGDRLRAVTIEEFAAELRPAWERKADDLVENILTTTRLLLPRVESRPVWVFG